MITGGTTHALCCLSACIKYAIRSGRLILPFSESHPYYEEKFYSLFKLNEGSQLARYFVSERNYDFIRDKYHPPYKDMPQKLKMTEVSGPKPDSNGNQRYFLKNLEESENDERYLDYPSRLKEEEEYIVTWGRHDTYWRNQLISVLSVLQPSERMKNIITYRRAKTSRQLKDERYIGVHFRNTDYKSDLEKTIDRAISSCRLRGINQVYWATDDIKSLRYAKEKLRRNDISTVSINQHIAYDKFNALNLHSVKSSDLEKSGSSKVEQIGIFFADVLTLSKADFLIRTSGTVPFLIESIGRSNKWNI